MPRRSAWQRFVERILPWYDPQDAEVRAVESERIHQEAIAARIQVEASLPAAMRAGYRQAGKRLTR